MKETAVQVMQRKIRNGLRKQREQIEHEQQAVWDRLKDTGRLKWTAEQVEQVVQFQNMYGLDTGQELADILIAEISKGSSK